MFIFTWLLSPRQRNIKKKSTAHNCDAGIFAIACGYTTNNNPGPEIMIRSQFINEFQVTHNDVKSLKEIPTISDYIFNRCVLFKSYVADCGECEYSHDETGDCIDK